MANNNFFIVIFSKDIDLQKLMEVSKTIFKFEYEDFIKISFRSKDDVDTNAFARAHFHGGGHINASGGKYFKNIHETIEDFKEKIEEEEF